MDLNVFAEKLGVEPSKLSEVVATEQIEILNNEEKETLLRNHGKTNYDQGKNAGVNMLFSNLKKSYTEGDNLAAKAFENASGIEDVLVNINKIHEEVLTGKIGEVKKSYEGNTDERIGALQEKYTSFEQSATREKTALQKLNEELQNQMKQVEQQSQQKFKQLKSDFLLQNEFSSLNFNVPKEIAAKGNDAIAEYNKIQRNNATLLFKSNFDIDYDESENPVFVNRATGEKMVDNLQNTLPLPELMKTFVQSNYLNVVPNRNGGRGGDDKYGGNNSMKGINSMDKFLAYANDKGVKVNSIEGQKLFKEVQEANPNVDF